MKRLAAVGTLCYKQFLALNGRQDLQAVTSHYFQCVILCSVLLMFYQLRALLPAICPVWEWTAGMQLPHRAITNSANISNLPVAYITVQFSTSSTEATSFHAQDVRLRTLWFTRKCVPRAGTCKCRVVVSRLSSGGCTTPKFAQGPQPRFSRHGFPPLPTVLGAVASRHLRRRLLHLLRSSPQPAARG